MAVKHLNRAKKFVNDEFYTLFEDIEKELSHYKEQLRDKIIYCNCDDVKYSKFYTYFINNFHDLQLKKVYFSHLETNGNSTLTSYDGTTEIKTELKGNGDSEVMSA